MYKRTAILLICVLVVSQAPQVLNAETDERQSFTQSNEVEVENISVRKNVLFRKETQSSPIFNSDATGPRSGFSATFTGHPHATFVYTNEDSIVIYNYSSNSFHAVRRPSANDIERDFSGRVASFIRPENARGPREIYRDKYVVIGTSFGPLAYDFRENKWAGDSPFKIELQQPMSFDTHPLPPKSTENYIVMPTFNGNVIISLPGWQDDSFNSRRKHPIRFADTRLSCIGYVNGSCALWSRTDFPIFLYENNVSVPGNTEPILVTKPNSDTIFVTWERGPSPIIAHNLSENDKLWEIESTRSGIVSGRVRQMELYNGSLFVLTGSSTSEGLIHEIDPQTGERLGETKTRGDRIIGFYKDQVIVSEDEDLIIKDINNSTIQEEDVVIDSNRLNADIVGEYVLIYNNYRIHVIDIESEHRISTSQLDLILDPSTILGSRAYWDRGNLYTSSQSPNNVLTFQNLNESLIVTSSHNGTRLYLHIEKLDGRPPKMAEIKINGSVYEIRNRRNISFMLEEVIDENRSRIELPLNITYKEQSYNTTISITISHLEVNTLNKATESNTNNPRPVPIFSDLPNLASFVTVMIAILMLRKLNKN